MNRTIVAVAIVTALIAAPIAFLAGAATAATTQAKTKKPSSAGQQAMRERQKKCGAEWKEAKAGGKVEKGMTWPKY